MNTDLDGLMVAVTASRRANELVHLLCSHGASTYLAPTIGIRPGIDNSDQVSAFLDVLRERDVTLAIFMTGPGVFALMSKAREMGKEAALVAALSHTQVVARSGKPKDALLKHGIRVDMVPEDATSEGVLNLVRQKALKGRVVTLVSHGSEAALLREGLRSEGAGVVEFCPYFYSLETDREGAQILDQMRFSPVMPDRHRVIELIQATIDGKIHAITFTSPPSARNLFAVALQVEANEALVSAMNRSVIVVAVGPPTKTAVEQGGVTVDVVPLIYKMGPMVKALCEYVKVRGPKLTLTERNRR